jgi:8-oxo-dGTP diphosphatase
MDSICVVAAIIIKDRKAFAVQRGYGDYKGWWEFPGGKIEPKESPEDALRREIREELDAEIRIERYFTTVEHDYPAFHLSMHCYLCTFDENAAPVLREHLSYKWLGGREVHSVKWLDADIPVIEKMRLEGIL